MISRIRVPIGTLSEAESTLLSIVSWEGSTSRRHLAERTTFSKSKVGAAISNLLDAGLLRETGEGDATGGRRAERLRLHPDLGVLVGIDLGATSLDVAVLGLDMAVLAAESEAADVRQGPGPVMARVKGLVKSLLARCGRATGDVLAVGMGVPGPVAFDSGLLVNPPIMPGWEGFSIRDDLAGVLSAPVFVDNDVNVLALGELWAGRRFAENFLVVKVGTGIGCGIVCGGRIYRGTDGAAGDVGHICVDPLGPVCHCGNVGCVEAMSAGPAIAREARAAAETGESPVLAELLRGLGTLTPVEVARASREGDMVANAIIQRSGALLGRMLASLVNFYNPSHIILTGGIARMGPLWLASIRQSVYGRSLALSTRHLELRLSNLPQHGGLVGAGVLALNSTLEAARA